MIWQNRFINPLNISRIKIRKKFRMFIYYNNRPIGKGRQLTLSTE